MGEVIIRAKQDQPSLINIRQPMLLFKGDSSTGTPNLAACSWFNTCTCDIPFTHNRELEWYALYLVAF